MTRTTRYAIHQDGRQVFVVATRKIANRVAANLPGSVTIYAVAA